MFLKTLDMLRLLLSLTLSGKLAWEKQEHDLFCAEIQEEKFTVEYIYLLRTDEVGSDKTLARLHALGLVHDFCIGTEGFDLICEMIATHDPEWEAWNEGCRLRFENGLEWLRQLEQESLTECELR